MKNIVKELRLFKLLVLALCLFIIFPLLASCAENAAEESSQSDGGESVSAENSGEASETEESGETSEESAPDYKYLTFDAPKPSESDLSAKDYTAVSEIAAENIIASVKDAVEGYVYINATAPVFEMTGLIDPDDNYGKYSKLYYEDMTKYSSDNNTLAKCLAGARLRFVTNSATFVLYAEMSLAYKMNHFCPKGAYGFDVYTGTGTARQYIGAPGNHLTDELCVHSTVDIGNGYKEVTLILPSYGGVNKLYIGLPENSSVALPDEYTYQKPVCFYGSSITQGASTSRPGVTYFNLLTLALDANCYNLGFSGSACGEQTVAEYIASLELSAFVLDYDYNAPTSQHLKDTHYEFYKTVRNAHPDIPIIILPHPYYTEANEGDRVRVGIVKDTYERAVAEGDKNVYFIDSEDFFPEGYRSIATIDNTHPNDIGHLYMAEAIYPVLKTALEASSAAQ